VLVGYLPLGATFGLLFVETGYPWPLATTMALLVYAGSAQFLAVGMLAARVPVPAVAAAILVLNARHLFYGLALLQRFRGSGWRKPYLIFGLTDETFALLTSVESPPGVDRRDLDLAITALNHCYWVTGCTLGALVGDHIGQVPRDLGFVLTALFVVLVVEQLRRSDRLYPFLIAATAACSTLLVVGGEQLLTLGLGLALAGLGALGWATRWRN
jgi:4-azaleucine resistance transporter AzlC